MEETTRVLNVLIKTDTVHLEGILSIPKSPSALVLFAHGSGSSRFSPRNLYVSRVFQNASFATLLFDLMTPQEERLDSITGEMKFNLNFLSNRIIGATKWAQEQPEIKGKIYY
eukprot:gene16114-19173_t